MINFENKILNLIYDYYPTNIQGLESDYNNTREIINLINISEKKILQDYNSWVCFKKKLTHIFLFEKIIIEKTTFFINQPSFSIQISEKGNDLHYNIYYSFLAPYFYVSKIKKLNEIIIEVEINPKMIFEIKSDKIYSIIKSFFSIELFPSNLLETKILNISFENIPYGDFTFRNALFNKNNSII